MEDGRWKMKMEKPRTLDRGRPTVSGAAEAAARMPVHNTAVDNDVQPPTFGTETCVRVHLRV